MVCLYVLLPCLPCVFRFFLVSRRAACKKRKEEKKRFPFSLIFCKFFLVLGSNNSGTLVLNCMMLEILS